MASNSLFKRLALSNQEGVCAMSGSNSRRGMGGRDVITVGIFSAIYFAKTLPLCSWAGYTAAMDFDAGLYRPVFTGIPHLMMCAKVQKVGSVLLMGLITGLIYFVTGQFTPVSWSPLSLPAAWGNWSVAVPIIPASGETLCPSSCSPWAWWALRCPSG